MGHATTITERDNAGRTVQIHVGSGGINATRMGVSPQGARHRGRLYFIDLLARMFLPAGYPNSVSPDYLRYQILNALQAFCNSLASLLSSRATLQGFGVGDPTATPTKALLLTVLQDVFSRLTTILSAHLLGSYLYPEAKTYRLLADVLNDTAVILDTLSPVFNTFPIPGLRVSSLCLSAVFKSLCAISAGGSKAAITLHFATPLNGKGDVGDLNAKDASKETVLALFGMLLGTLIVPFLTTPWTTYPALVILVGLHLAINYFGVRGLVLRSLNRQRLGIAWISYRKSQSSEVPTPSQTAKIERLFERSGIIRDITTGETIGQCAIGSSFSDILRGPIPPGLLELFREEHYIIWFDHRCLRQSQDLTKHSTVYGFRRIHIFLKEGYTNADQLKAWIHAVAICCLGAPLHRSVSPENLDALDAIQTAYNMVSKHLPEFTAKLQSAGWNTVDCALVTGSPDAVVTAVTSSASDLDAEEKKFR